MLSSASFTNPPLAKDYETRLTRALSGKVEQTQDCRPIYDFCPGSSCAFRFADGTHHSLLFVVLNNLQDCYRILELEPGATLEDVKGAYRELVKVWHPDRFCHDPTLQKKAQEKLKLINLAYQQISTDEGAKPPRIPSSSRSSSPRPEKQRRAAGSNGSSDRSTSQKRKAPPQSNWAQRNAPLAVIFVIVSIVAIALTARVFYAVFFAFGETSHKQTGNASSTNTQPSLSYQPPDVTAVQAKSEPRKRFSREELVEHIRSLGFNPDDINIEQALFDYNKEPEPVPARGTAAVRPKAHFIITVGQGQGATTYFSAKEPKRVGNAYKFTDVRGFELEVSGTVEIRKLPN